MTSPSVFERYELKYLLTRDQKEKILRAMEPHMALDQYGRTVIRNLYLDTESYLLARRSIERPVYKEKLRVRSYAKASPESTVFVELKKKYESIVYKRRIALPEEAAMAWLKGEGFQTSRTQIAKEIDYFLAHYGSLRPVAFLSYEREAYYATDGGNFRVTFDENILCREEELTLTSDPWGRPLLPEGMTLMEIKCSGGLPLWMVRILSREGIRRTSFSKYGAAYEKYIYPTLKEAVHNA